MTGLLTVDGTRYLFRDDTGHSGVWAWCLHDTSDKPKTHKWDGIPKRAVDIELFDLDDPPPTAGWFPFS